MNADISKAPDAPRKIDPGLKFALEIGPLALFYIAYLKLGIFWATGVLMAGVTTSLVVSYIKLRRFPIMALVTAGMVLVFGSITLFLHDATLIKVKVTVLYALFSLTLFVGLAIKRPFLAVMFDGAIKVTQEGWRLLNWRWAFFFAALAVLNEIIRLNFSEAVWANFKFFGFLPLTLVFALAQTPLIMRYAMEEDKEPDSV